MAYLYRKRGYWYVACRKPNGWKRESLKTKQRAEARQALSRFVRTEEDGEVLPDTSVLLADFVSYYLEHRKQTLGVTAFGSQEKYRIPLFLRFLTANGVRRLDAVQHVHVEAYIRQRQATVSAETVKNDLFLIHFMFNTAIQWGFVSTNPAEGIKAPRVPDTRKSRALSEEEVEKLLAAADGSPLKPLIATAVFAGLRKGELVNLQWKDIDWQAGFINVCNKKGERAFTTKSGRHQRVPMHRRLRELLCL